ncbi:hypothetical protein [Paracoccus sp. ME4]|uniref:hypothetical protein n=1 Tax=Paracoccus sp. ME4 TaxID=3138066 RepID=UPI00398B89C4
MTGGPGADILQGWLDAEGVMDRPGTGHVAVVTDVDPAEGRAEITVPGLDPAHAISGIGLAEQDGDTLVLKDGRTALRLGGVTGLTGVIQIPGMDGETRLVDKGAIPSPASAGTMGS